MNLIVLNSRLIKRATVLLSLLTIVLLGIYIVHLERKFEEVSQLLSDRLLVVEDIQGRLAQLNADIGYGGFIHNVKNYVLRRDEIYWQQLVANYDSAIRHLSELRKVLSSPQEIRALDQIDDVLTVYKENIKALPRVRTLSQLGREDALVKVDDASALKAFDLLYESVRARTHQVLEDVRGRDEDIRAYIKLGYLMVLLVVGMALFILILVDQVTSRYRDAKFASEAKSEFLSAMSHEIRTPLNGILGLVQLLNVNKFTKEERYHLTLIQSSGQLLLSMLNNVLDLTKIEAGEMELEVMPVDVNYTLGMTTNFFNNLGSEKGVLVSYHSTLEEGSYWMCDPTKLRQVLSNLLSNAIKFTHEGQIDVNVSEVAAEHVQEGQARSRICLEVADTGIGMSADSQVQIFDRFRQTDQSATRRHGGSGLGLSIVKELSTLMGGDVQVESQLGKGSVFRVMLPMRRAELQDLEVEEISGANGMLPLEGLRVLVVEDNIVNGAVAKGFVENLGMKVTIAHDGVEALHLFEKIKPDLILMDVNMPNMDGLEATQRIRALEDGGSVPILGLTADAFSHTKQRCLEVGMNSVVHKPYSFNLLKKRIYDNLR